MFWKDFQKGVIYKIRSSELRCVVEKKSTLIQVFREPILNRDDELQSSYELPLM